MNLLEQKIRKQMIDETMIGRGFGRLMDKIPSRKPKGPKPPAGSTYKQPDRPRKPKGEGDFFNDTLIGRTIASGARAGLAAGIHATVGRISDMATQGLGGGDDRVGPTNTPMGAKADVARGSGDVKKAINPLRSLERTAAGDEITDVDAALKKLGSKEAKAFGERQQKIRDDAAAEIEKIGSSTLNDIQKKAEINQAIRDRQDKLKQFDTDTIGKAVAKQRRGIGAQVAALAGGETEAEKASQFLKYLRGRDRDR